MCVHVHACVSVCVCVCVWVGSGYYDIDLIVYVGGYMKYVYAVHSLIENAYIVTQRTFACQGH